MTQQLQQTIFQEMMSHTALFTHPKPQKVAILGEKQDGITHEILKHPAISEVWLNKPSSIQEPRIKLFTQNPISQAFDIVIITAEDTSSISNAYPLLQDEGILLCQSASPFEPHKIRAQYQQLKKEGFYEIQLLSFPQPDYPTGWRSALIAIKKSAFKRVREKDIFNRTFTTQYYNFDVHKASLALPEFMREGLVV